MAPIKVIGASLGRCGTDSLRVALDILGAEDFLDAYCNRENTDWDKLYEKYDACTDWTASTFYKDLFYKYPDAKVLLTVRPVDSWYESVKNTILRTVYEMPEVDSSDPSYQLYKLADAICMDGNIRNPEKFANERKLKQLYEDHIAEVKRTIPAEQLCVLELGEGWEKLCQFLGKKVPQVPYPKVNTTTEFEQYFFKGDRPDNLAPVSI